MKKELDIIKLKYNIIDSENYAGEKIKMLTVDTFINGKEICNGYPIDIFDLEKSLTDSGEYYLFNCTCGVPECRGIWEAHKVLVKEESIIWSILKPEQHYLEFNKKQITDEINNLINELLDLKDFDEWKKIYYYWDIPISEFVGID